jgi:hypothetical protein
MKTMNLISLLIAMGSLAVSIFVYFQSRKQFEIASQPFIYIDGSLEDDKLAVSVQNIVGSDVLLIDRARVGDWDLFGNMENDLYNFIPNQNIVNRPVGPGENINLFMLELKDPDQLDNIPNKLPLVIHYRGRAERHQIRSDDIDLFVLKNALENKSIKRELTRVRNDYRIMRNDFSIMLDRNRDIQVPDQIRHRLNTEMFLH